MSGIGDVWSTIAFAASKGIRCVAQGPGLGIDPDQEVIARYRVG